MVQDPKIEDPYYGMKKETAVMGMVFCPVWLAVATMMMLEGIGLEHIWILVVFAMLQGVYAKILYDTLKYGFLNSWIHFAALVVCLVTTVMIAMSLLLEIYWVQTVILFGHFIAQVVVARHLYNHEFGKQLSLFGYLRRLFSTRPLFYRED